MLSNETVHLSAVQCLDPELLDVELFEVWKGMVLKYPHYRLLQRLADSSYKIDKAVVVLTLEILEDAESAEYLHELVSDQLPLRIHV